MNDGKISPKTGLEQGGVDRDKDGARWNSENLKQTKSIERREQGKVEKLR